MAKIGWIGKFNENHLLLPTLLFYELDGHIENFRLTFFSGIFEEMQMQEREREKGLPGGGRSERRDFISGVRKW